jgi:ribosomal protein L4
MQDRVQRELLSGQAAVLYLHPTPRDYSFTMNKKEKRAALKSALSSRVQRTNSSFWMNETGCSKDKEFQKCSGCLKVKKAFVVLDSNDNNTMLFFLQETFRTLRPLR